MLLIPDLQRISQDAVSDRRSFMQPKPKAVSAKPGPQSACSLAIKRTSDELASRHVHSTVLQMKQPWQKGQGSFPGRSPFGNVCRLPTLYRSWGS